MKRFADLALALAHEARTTQLLAISRGEPPPSLNMHKARLSPLATLDEEAQLLFSDPFHDHLTEYDLAQYTIHRPHDKIPPLKQSASANDTRSGSRKRDNSRQSQTQTPRG
eukprot:scaffold11917_cov128-Isochrysis_galbana.AAC.1